MPILIVVRIALVCMVVLVRPISIVIGVVLICIMIKLRLYVRMS